MSKAKFYTEKRNKYVYDDKIYLLPTIEYRKRTIEQSTLIGVRFRFWHWWYNVSVIYDSNILNQLYMKKFFSSKRHINMLNGLVADLLAMALLVLCFIVGLHEDSGKGTYFIINLITGGIAGATFGWGINQYQASKKGEASDPKDILYTALGGALLSPIPWALYYYAGWFGLLPIAAIGLFGFNYYLWKPKKK